ncbi:MAG TPA: protease HtpX [Crenotrichaceae bacterium]|nr:protease HtpX [Crenotrichaceae bacterium]
MTRILLFMATNAAILLVITILFRVFGLDSMLYQNGVDLNLPALLIMSAVIGMTGSIISLFMSKTMAKRSMGVQVIDQPTNQTEKWLLEVVSRQAKQAGIGMPEVGIFNTPEPNAFATGANKNNALVAVSAGLLQSMTQDEVEAVVGHEISHVANGDMVTLTLIQGVVNTFVYFLASIIGHVVDRAVFRSENGRGMGYFATQMVAQIVLSFLASMIVMWFSRWREFHADKGGANLAGRQKMINALRALQGASSETIPAEFQAFAISAGGGLSRLFSSHPPLEDRIRALENLRD